MLPWCAGSVAVDAAKSCSVWGVQEASELMCKPFAHVHCNVSELHVLILWDVLCTVSQKVHQLWNGIAENYKDWFRWHLAEYSKYFTIEFACFSFHVGLLFRQLFVFQTGHRKQCEDRVLLQLADTLNSQFKYRDIHYWNIWSVDEKVVRSLICYYWILLNIHDETVYIHLIIVSSVLLIALTLYQRRRVDVRKLKRNSWARKQTILTNHREAS